jgi:hypothetical protein
LFDPWVIKLDPLSTRIDCVFFDGASNVQKAGRLLEARYPRIHVQACAAHSVSLFFADVAKLWQMKLLLLHYRRLYRLFGSGAMHSPFALFIAQTKIFNGGRRVGLLKAADTRMAGHAYAQCRMLRLREPLIATIGSAAYKNLKLKGFPQNIEEHLLNPDMWSATYALQRCLFPMIRVLRLSDKSACGGMSKIVYLVHKTDDAILKSQETLKELKYFTDQNAMDAEEEEGIDLEDDDFDKNDCSDDEGVQFSKDVDEDDNEDKAAEAFLDDDSVDEEERQHLGEQIHALWRKRRLKLITPLALAAWFCSPDPNIRQDVVDHELGSDRLEVEKVVIKLYHPMRPEDMGKVIQVFWRELNDFQTKQGPSYSRKHIWDTDEIRKGNCHLWHKLYSVPFTKVFGKVACRVCSKPLGCGLAERNWGNLKHLKSNKRSHLSADKAQKQATVFGAACMDKSKAMQAAEEASGELQETRWSDADIDLNTGLESWDPDCVMPAAVVPKRLFNAWIEEWEWECIFNNDSVAEAKLLQKYQGMRWFDPDEDEFFTADDCNMEYKGGRQGGGWCVIGIADGDGDLESWPIDVVIDQMASVEQEPALNVEVIMNDVLRASNEERMVEEEAKRKARRRKK